MYKCTQPKISNYNKNRDVFCPLNSCLYLAQYILDIFFYHIPVSNVNSIHWHVCLPLSPSKHWLYRLYSSLCMHQATNTTAYCSLCSNTAACSSLCTYTAACCYFSTNTAACSSLWSNTAACSSLCTSTEACSSVHLHGRLSISKHWHWNFLISTN